MKNKSPAFQFYPKDYLSDINVQIMSLPERGAYINLLCHEWLEGGLPNDDDILSILSGLGEEWFGKSGEKIKKCFTIKSGNFINPRLEKERKNQKNRRKKRSDAGRKGNETRWGKGSKDISKGSQCDKDAIAKDRSTTTTTTTTTTTKKKDILVFDFGKVWKRYPNKDGKKAAEKHFKTTIKKEEDYIAINKALDNYLKSDKVKKGFIKNGSTWFNNWQDWIEVENTSESLFEKDYKEGVNQDGTF